MAIVGYLVIALVVAIYVLRNELDAWRSHGGLPRQDAMAVGFMSLGAGLTWPALIILALISRLRRGHG